MRLSGTKTNSIHQYRGLGNQLWDLGGARPTLDLNFAHSKDLRDAVTGRSLVDFTRASSGTYVGSDGLIKTATTNEARFDHNPTTGESLGLLVEEQRTNSIRNNTMVGAVAGTPGTLPTNWSVNLGGLVSEVVALGTETGTAYVDIRISGTASGTSQRIAMEASGVVAALTGQIWSRADYLKLVNGSLSGVTTRLRITERTSAGAFVAAQLITVVPFSASTPLSACRLTGSATLNGGATTAFINPELDFAVSIGASYDFTLRIGLPQLEQGAFATSVIPTSTTAVTRSADVASITGTNFSSWYRQDEGTVFADINSAPINTLVQLTYDISEGIGNERYFGRRTSGTSFGFAVIDGGVTQADAGSAVAIAGGARYLSTAAYRVNSINVAVAGQLGTEDTAATLPTVDRMFIGQNFASGQHVNGTIRRLTYWPQRLSNSTLQTITR